MQCEHSIWQGLIRNCKERILGCKIDAGLLCFLEGVCKVTGWLRAAASPGFGSNLLYSSWIQVLVLQPELKMPWKCSPGKGWQGMALHDSTEWESCGFKPAFKLVGDSAGAQGEVCTCSGAATGAGAGVRSSPVDLIPPGKCCARALLCLQSRWNSLMTTDCPIIEPTKTSLSIIKSRSAGLNMEKGEEHHCAAQGQHSPLSSAGDTGGTEGLQWEENPPVSAGRERGKQALLPSQTLLKTQGSFCMSNKSHTGHTNHLELPVGIQ